MTYIITTDSSVDVGRKHLQEIGIDVINYKYELNGDFYEDDGEASQSYDEFYDILDRPDSSGKTSAINTLEYIEFFKKYLENGNDVIHVMLSSGLSSSYNNACLAKAELEETYPNNKLLIIDSKLASSAVALLVDKLASLRDEGMSMEDVYNWGEENKYFIHAFFTSTDLAHFVRGGRLSAPVGTIGGKLNICPLMRIDKDGKLTIEKIIRTPKKAYSTELKYFEKLRIEDTPIYVNHAKTYEDFNYFVDKVEKIAPEVNIKSSLTRVGTTIGVHTGPKTICVFFWSDKSRW